MPGAMAGQVRLDGVPRDGGLEIGDIALDLLLAR